jgi:acyl-CoA reductase-like NAD-dependent aldehyde dehydrogenase
VVRRADAAHRRPQRHADRPGGGLRSGHQRDHLGDEQDAIRIANESKYGLSGSVYTADEERGIALASRVRTGTITVNGAVFDITVPFGGYKQSGLGREGGPEGLAEYLEFKSLHLMPRRAAS